MSKHTDPQTSRVAFFSDSLPERNGTGAYYFDLIGQLKSTLPKIHIFQPKRNVRINWLSIPMPGDPSQRLITPDIFRIHRGFNELKPTIIVSVTPGPFGILGYLYAKKYKLRFITAFHTDFEKLAKIYWNPLFGSFANLYLRTINTLFCKNAEFTLVHNSKLVPQIKALGARLYKIMGTPLPSFYLNKAIEPMPNPFKQVCFAGRLAAEKNVDQIIEAAKHFETIQFVIVGEGPLKKELKHSAKSLKNVIFKGWLRRDALVDIVDQSNCLLLPSKFETFGSVAFEAMSRGRPTIVSVNSGIIEWDCLKEPILVLDNSTRLIDLIQRLYNESNEDRIARGDQSRIAALAFNEMTLDQWRQLLESL